MRARPVIHLILLAILGVLLVGGCARVHHPAGALIELRKGWEYRWGDAPADTDQHARWLTEPVGGGGWQRYDPDSRPSNDEGRRTVWFRMRLPLVSGESPTLFLALQRLRITFEVLLDGRAAYRSGERGPSAGPPSLWYVIPLPDSAPGQLIAFRVESPEPEYLEAPAKEIVFGPSMAVHAKIVRQGILSFSFGALFLVVGAYSLFAHWKRRSQQFYLSFSFGLMAISGGGMMLIGCELNQIYLYYGSVGWYLHMASMLLFPVGLWAYVEQSIGAGWRRFVRRFWQFHIGYALATLALDLSGLVRFYPTLLQLWFLLLLVESLAFVPLLMRSIRSGQRTARLFGVGMAVLTVCGAFDTLSGLEIVPVYLELFPWGLAMFIGVLVYIQEDVFGRTQQRLRDYSQTLEAQTEELRMHRDRLEDLVVERTRELEQATVAAQAASRAKSEFLAHMSHELRTPLNGILGYAQILRREGTLPKRVAKGVGVIQESGEHLLAMINEVLDLAKVEAGRLELEEDEVHLGEFLHGVADMAEGWARAKGLAFRRRVPATPGGVVRVDAKRLRQVLLNLLGNAVKFTPNGSVGLEVDRLGEALRFRVVDTGLGIPAVDLDDLFQPFQQQSDSGHREGTGLGLAISQKLVRMMGGEIRVESAVGAGSTFGFDLTLPEVAAPTVKHGLQRPRPVGLRAPLRVLVVDDRAENRDVLREMLAPLGFDVGEADSGVSAVQACRTQAPDVLLLDLMMPGLDGFDTLRQIRELPGGDQIPAVAVSASAFPDTRKEANDAGFDGFIPKPVRLDELLELLTERLNPEWLVAAPEGREPANPVTEPHLVAPPSADVEALYELARVGDVVGIEKRLETLRGEGVCGPFTARVAALAEEFEIQALQSFLSRWRGPRRVRANHSPGVASGSAEGEPGVSGGSE